MPFAHSLLQQGPLVAALPLHLLGFGLQLAHMVAVLRLQICQLLLMRLLGSSLLRACLPACFHKAGSPALLQVLLLEGPLLLLLLQPLLPVLVHHLGCSGACNQEQTAVPYVMIERTWVSQVWLWPSGVCEQCQGVALGRHDWLR